MRHTSMLALVLVVVLTSGCARTYYSPDAIRLSRAHKVVAILPPDVNITSNRKIDPQVLRDQANAESLTFQKEMASWMLMRKRQYYVDFDIQDVATSNALLTREGYFIQRELTAQEICVLLDVDAVIRSQFAMSKPLSEGAAVVIGVFTGIWATTNEITVTMDIFDRSTDQIIWNYRRMMSGSVLSSVPSMIDNLMYEASGEMPYSRKK